MCVFAAAQEFGNPITTRTTATGRKDGFSYGNVYYKGIKYTSTSDSGGAFFGKNGLIYGLFADFNGNAKFEGNESAAAGGALGINNTSLSFQSNISFNGEHTQFINNSAVNYGGAVFLGEKGSGAPSQAARSTINFNGANLLATGNSSIDGGFLYNYGGTVNIASTAVISGNTATGNGGAFYIQAGSSLYATNSINFTGNATIENNTAAGLGGAFYLTPRNGVMVGSVASSLSFSGAGTTTLSGNADGLGANDVYMESGTWIDITGPGNYLFNSGIASVSGTNVNHSGTGYFLADMKRFRGTYTQSNASGSSTIKGDVTDSTYLIQKGKSEFTDSSAATIKNDGTVTFSGTNKTIGGTLTSTSNNNSAGTLNITGTITNNITVQQNAVTVGNTGNFYTSANTLNLGSKSIINNGNLYFTSGVNSNNISGTGTTVISDKNGATAVTNSTGTTI